MCDLECIDTKALTEYNILQNSLNSWTWKTIKQIRENTDKELALQLSEWQEWKDKFVSDQREKGHFF